MIQIETVVETLKDRGLKYGTMEDNAKITQDLMKVVSASPNWDNLPVVHRECLHMIMAKISRMLCGEYMHLDNPHDISGYAMLLEDWIKEQGNEIK